MHLFSRASLCPFQIMMRKVFYINFQIKAGNKSGLRPYLRGPRTLSGPSLRAPSLSLYVRGTLYYAGRENGFCRRKTPARVVPTDACVHAAFICPVSSREGRRRASECRYVSLFDLLSPGIKVVLRGWV